MSIRILRDGKGLPVRKTDNFTDICEPIVYNKLVPRGLKSCRPSLPATVIALPYISLSHKAFLIVYRCYKSGFKRLHELSVKDCIIRHEQNKQNKTNKRRGVSPRADYTDRATAACRRSDCQLLRI
jgi:hypothetical protein